MKGLNYKTSSKKYRKKGKKGWEWGGRRRHGHISLRVQLSCPLSYRQPGDAVASWVGGFRVQRSNSWESLPDLLPSCGLQVIVLLFCVCEPVCVCSRLSVGCTAAPSRCRYRPSAYLHFAKCFSDESTSEPVSQWTETNNLMVPLSSKITCECLLT